MTRLPVGVPPYEMRSATTADAEALRTLLHSREAWMAQRGYPGSRNRDAVLGLLDSEPGPVKILTEDGEILGCAVVHQTIVHDPGWSAQERTEPTMGMRMIYTRLSPFGSPRDPLALYMTWWAGDWVARHHPEVEWIRCTVPSRAVRDLLIHRDGWAEVRRTQNATFAHLYLMQRRPERKHGLAALIADPEQARPLSPSRP
ncbi:hypothetical protein ACFXP3_16760 [Streptomyces sp. NPDC059096]|uniref:hypothetical protein n=1 Tax=Streptomyces sp. NPDC059096 TaxID=3346727 RepID=UPI0036C20689